jgi:hypothetical protein
MKKRFKPVEMVVIGAIVFMLCATQSWAIQIKNGATAVITLFIANVSNTSQGVSGLTTATTNISVVRANGSQLNLTTNTLSEIDAANLPGLYHVTLNGTHTNTTGELLTIASNGTIGIGRSRDEVVDNLASDIYADTHTTGVKVIANGILSPQAFNTTGNLTGNVSQVNGFAENSITATAIAAGAITSSEAPNLDVAVSTRGTGNLTASDNVGINWGDITNPTTSVGLSGTTISTSQQVASVSGAVGSVTGNVGGNVNGTVVGNVTVTNCDVAVSTRGTSNLTTSDLSNLDVAVSTRGISNLTTTDISDSVGTLNNISAADVRNEMDTNSTKLTAINNTVQTNLDEKVSTRSDFNASTDYVQLNGTKVL